MTFSEISADAEKTKEVPADAAGLRAALIGQREYTLAMYADLPRKFWTPRYFPFHATVNPPLWELAHIAWFQEFFILRWRADDVQGARTPSCLEAADHLFNSAIVPHQSRWQLDYPSRATCFDYMRRVLDNVVLALEKCDGPDYYGFQLALMHEDMHAEALAMTLNTLDRNFPDVVRKRMRLPAKSDALPEMRFAASEVSLGASGRTFSFDNEKPVQVVSLKPFAIDLHVVSAADFAIFFTSNAYRDPDFWSAEGNAWRDQVRHKRFAASRNDEFNLFAAMHVNCHEAEAYCRWRGRRLPTEAEWEHAAATSAAFFASTGHVWEWTSSPFAPHPGFATGRYRDYSEPWFGSHVVLKGGSFVTHPRLKYPQYRNFYTPGRQDMFCGFRTCAIT